MSHLYLYPSASALRLCPAWRWKSIILISFTCEAQHYTMYDNNVCNILGESMRHHNTWLWWQKKTQCAIRAKTNTNVQNLNPYNLQGVRPVILIIDTSQKIKWSSVQLSTLTGQWPYIPCFASTWKSEAEIRIAKFGTISKLSGKATSTKLWKLYNLCKKYLIRFQKRFMQIIAATTSDNVYHCGNLCRTSNLT